MKPYLASYLCDCGNYIKTTVYPYKPAIKSHQYEDNEEADGGYCDPEECLECGRDIDYEDVQEHE